MTPHTIAVVSAGLGQPASTRLLADRLGHSVVEQSAGRSAQIVSIELRKLATDITNSLLTGFPDEALAAAIETITAADALIAVTPIFSASYSGLFKSFFDVLDPEALADKPTLIAATGGSARHSLALEFAVRPMLSYLRARTVQTAVFAATEDFGSDTAGAPLGNRITRAASELLAMLDGRAPAAGADPFDLAFSFEELLQER